MFAALACAEAEARKSDETFRLGAAVLRGRRVVAAGRNKNVNACGLWSVHAEISATWQVRPDLRRGCHVVVVRVLRDGGYGRARPCGACRRALAKYGVARVTYTTGDDSLPLETLTL